MNLDDYKAQFPEEDAAPGWDSIDAALKPIYGDKEPRHYGTVIKHMLGGPDPIDGISSYFTENGGIKHEHVISYGFTSLYYDEESVGNDYSGYGFELSFRLRVARKDESVNWVINVIQNIARYVFGSGNVFEHGHFIPANGPIALDTDTKLWAFCFVNDPELNAISTPHGKVEFIQMVGITQQEYEALRDNNTTVDELVKILAVDNPLMVTDLNRDSII